MIPLRKSPEFELALAGMRRQMDQERKEGFRGVITRGRRMASLDVAKMSVRESFNCVIEQSDVDAGYATEDQIGLFWFVVGYSDPDGGDVVHP
jgi:hypothetical protein